VRLFREGHIPGAQHADLHHDLAAPGDFARGGRHPFPPRKALADVFSRFGIDRDTSVVTYDDTDHAYAARAWAMLRWLGHAKVQVLDGGYRAWVAAGLPVEMGEAKPRPRAAFEPSASLLDVRGFEALGAGQLVDVRAPERFRGEVEPIDPVAGHIPGARNLPYVSLLAPDGKFLPAAELARRLPTEPAVYYCGSGVTSCVALVAAEVVGRRAALYPGSWSEWCRRPGAPIAKGD